jgi:hypothetical protein
LRRVSAETLAPSVKARDTADCDSSARAATLWAVGADDDEREGRMGHGHGRFQMKARRQISVHDGKRISSI